MKLTFSLLLTLMTLISLQSRADMFDPPPADENYQLPGALVVESSDRVLVLVDGYDVQSLSQLHEILAKALKLPATYGKNFDALYDVLTDSQVVGKSIKITITSGTYLQLHIGKRNLKALLNVLNDAEQADPSHVQIAYWQ